MANVDLDAARAARAEANGEAPTVTFGGVTFTLPTEMPFKIVESVNAMQEAQAKGDGNAIMQELSSVAEDLFGDHYPEFVAMKPSMFDMQALLENIAPMYGMTTGESTASEE